MNDATRKYIEALEEHIEALNDVWDGYDPDEYVAKAEQYSWKRKGIMELELMK